MTSTATSVGAYGTVLLLVAALVFGSRSLHRGIRAWLASAADVEIEIRPAAAGAPSPAAPDAPGREAGREIVTADIRLLQRVPQLQLSPPFLRFSAPAFEEGPAAFSAGEPYAAAAAGFRGSAVGKRLSNLVEAAGRQGVVVRLAVAPELAGHPWEAWMGLSLPQPAGARFVRTGEDLQLKPFVEGEVRVVVGEKWAALFEAAWSRRPRGAGARFGPEAHRLDPGDAVRVLHVVGRPIMTRGGPRLQVEGFGREAERYQTKGYTRASGNLLGARDLVSPALGASGRLLVLQAEPAEGLAERSVGRSEAACLRALAAECFAGGVQTVLVLPAVPADPARRAVEHLAGALGRSAPALPGDPRPWLKAVGRIRSDITAWRPPGTLEASAGQPAELLSELSWDVGLSWRRERGPLEVDR